jgi:hypothetical protein
MISYRRGSSQIFPEHWCVLGGNLRMSNASTYPLNSTPPINTLFHLLPHIPQRKAHLQSYKVNTVQTTVTHSVTVDIFIYIVSTFITKD